MRAPVSWVAWTLLAVLSSFQLSTSKKFLQNQLTNRFQTCYTRPISSLFLMSSFNITNYGSDPNFQASYSLTILVSPIGYNLEHQIELPIQELLSWDEQPHKNAPSAGHFFHVCLNALLDHNQRQSVFSFQWLWIYSLEQWTDFHPVRFTLLLAPEHPGLFHDILGNCFPWEDSILLEIFHIESSARCQSDYSLNSLRWQYFQGAELLEELCHW